MNRFISCSYCQAKNPISEKTCIACGAPLLEGSFQTPPTQGKSPASMQEIKEDKTVKMANKVAAAYGHFWQSVIEAMVIAAVGFGIGFTGAVINFPLLGVLGAGIVGLCVGLTLKYSIFTLFSSPLGLLLGSLLCIPAAIFKAPPVSYVILMTFGASLGAVLGGLHIPFRFRSPWHKTRPFLGTAGGLVFGFLGSLLGTGVHLVYTNFF